MSVFEIVIRGRMLRAGAILIAKRAVVAEGYIVADVVGVRPLSTGWKIEIAAVAAEGE